MPMSEANRLWLSPSFSWKAILHRRLHSDKAVKREGFVAGFGEHVFIAALLHLVEIQRVALDREAALNGPDPIRFPKKRLRLGLLQAIDPPDQAFNPSDGMKDFRGEMEGWFHELIASGDTIR